MEKTGWFISVLKNVTENDAKKHAALNTLTARHLAKLEPVLTLNQMLQESLNLIQALQAHCNELKTNLEKYEATHTDAGPVQSKSPGAAAS
jgi:DNA repair ATPase RecN